MGYQNNRPVAIARMQGSGEAAGLAGFVKFYQRPGGVLVVTSVSGLPGNGSGIFGFHIHEGSACSGAGFPLTGGHYNPKGMPHPRHAGDLLPLLSCGGKAYLAFLTDRFSIPDILGRTVVIHSREDDFRTQPSGDAGEKIGCGVIQKFA